MLFKQLSAWMLHGMLLDEYNEFFISTQPTKVHDTGSSEIAHQVQSQRSVIIRGITGKELDKVRVSKHIHNQYLTIFSVLNSDL